MKRAIVFLAVMLAANAAQADDEYAIGPIKTGMTYDEVRAATPGVTWKALPFRGIWADNAFRLGGLMFGAQYIPEPWDRFHIIASHAAPLTDIASCRADYEKVTNAVQATLGNLQAPPQFAPSEIGFQAQQEEVKIGGGSALLIRHIDNAKPESEWPFELSSSTHAGATTVNMNGEVRAAMEGKPTQCVVRISLGEYTKRPRRGSLAFADLVFTASPSIGRLHHSLDGAMPPAQPMNVALDCQIDDSDGHLGDCVADAKSDPAAAPYVSAALQRATDYRVADKTTGGKWTPGENTIATLRIAASDRRDGLKVDASKQELLKFLAQPRAEEMVRFYPRDALTAGVGADIQVGCVVQTDFSVVCPEISAPDGAYQAQFRAAASQLVTLYRVAPTLTDGTSAVGTGFRATLKLSP
ncbi:MAG TPA: hypothetical protein VGM36_11920 [Rhizomicrobium sp.]|jgi:hypothetical protein